MYRLKTGDRHKTKDIGEVKNVEERLWKTQSNSREIFAEVKVPDEFESTTEGVKVRHNRRDGGERRRGKNRRGRKRGRRRKNRRKGKHR